jgi:hypothetical protein
VVRHRHKRTQSTQVISASTVRSRHFSCDVEEWEWKPRSISSRLKKMMCGRLNWDPVEAILPFVFPMDNI